VFSRLKKKFKDGVQRFKEDFSEAKSKPRSKRKSLFLGFATVLGIFGVVLVGPVLPAIAKDIPKDIPKDTPNSSEVAPAPPTQPPTSAPARQVITGLSGAAAGLSTLAVSSGSFMIGAICGLIVGVGILKAQKWLEK